MVYHKVTLNPTSGQIDDLSRGTEVKLSHEHFHGEIPFHLTTAQVNKISKAAANGKGCTLKLSAAQIKHHAMNGEGVFGDAARFTYKLLKPVIRAGISKGLTYGRDVVEKKIHKMTGLDDDQHGGSFLGSAGRWLGHKAVDAGIDLMGGEIKPKRAARKQKGGSFLGDAGRWLGHAAVDGAVDLFGGELQPNQFKNNNERLNAALFQKKVSGRGLYQ